MHTDDTRTEKCLKIAAKINERRHGISKKEIIRASQTSKKTVEEDMKILTRVLPGITRLKKGKEIYYISQGNVFRHPIYK